MTSRKRDLMTRRDAALAAGDIPTFQRLTTEIAKLPMNGVPELTPKDIAKWNKSHVPSVTVIVKSGQTFQGITYYEPTKFDVSPDYARHLIAIGVAEPCAS